ncbi:hypothetical protein ACJQWK_03507 [Exserohilum turcicum]
MSPANNDALLSVTCVSWMHRPRRISRFSCSLCISIDMSRRHLAAAAVSMASNRLRGRSRAISLPAYKHVDAKPRIFERRVLAQESASQARQRRFQQLRLWAHAM